MSYMKVIAAVLMLILVTWLLTLRAHHAPAENRATEAGDELTTSWVARRQSLAAYEQEQSRLRIVVIQQRKLYHDGEVSKSQLVETEQSFINVLARIQEARRSLMETETAMVEAEINEQPPGQGGASTEGTQETQASSAHQRSAPWSIAQAPNIDKYFLMFQAPSPFWS